MKQVIIIQEEPIQEEKPVEFTHRLSETKGWEKATYQPSDYDKTVYLGSCAEDGDMFAAYYSSGTILIFKGHLNSGKY